MSDLTRSPPRIILVGHGDYFHFVTGDDLDSYAALETFPELSALLDADYAFTEAIGHLDLYTRR